jgi:hypothetical protein
LRSLLKATLSGDAAIEAYRRTSNGRAMRHAAGPRNQRPSQPFQPHAGRGRYFGVGGDGNSNMKKLLMCAALVGGLGLAMQAHADDRSTGVKVGTLSCHEASGWGFVFGSSHNVRCVFSNGSHVEHYEGSISKFGVDIGYQQSGVLLWEVIAPSEHPERGALEGHYGGLTAGAAIGVGLDANALIGGSDRSIALQPLSIQGMTGLNVAAGVGELTLHSHAGD